jgi:hypothetical protein
MVFRHFLQKEKSDHKHTNQQEQMAELLNPFAEVELDAHLPLGAPEDTDDSQPAKTDEINVVEQVESRTAGVRRGRNNGRRNPRRNNRTRNPRPPPAPIPGLAEPQSPTPSISQTVPELAQPSQVQVSVEAGPQSPSPSFSQTDPELAQSSQVQASVEAVEVIDVDAPQQALVAVSEDSTNPLAGTSKDTPASEQVPTSNKQDVTAIAGTGEDGKIDPAIIAGIAVSVLFLAVAVFAFLMLRKKRSRPSERTKGIPEIAQKMHEIESEAEEATESEDESEVEVE